MYFLSNYDFSECICTVDDKMCQTISKQSNEIYTGV